LKEENINIKFINDKKIQEKYLWKYIDLHKFLSFLFTKSLYLTRLDKFEDKREGTTMYHLINKMIKRDLDKHSIFNNAREYATIDSLGSTMNRIEDELKLIQRFNFANCWVIGGKNIESTAMWNLYSKPNSIAIRIKYSDFKDKFSNETFENFGNIDELICSPVNYLDFQNEKSIFKNKAVDPVLIKDISFEHEKEFRIVLKEKHRKIPPINYKEHISRKHIEKVHNSIYDYPGHQIKLREFESYNFEIIHHPKSEQWAKDNINEVIKKFEFKFKVSDSNLELK